ncbi:hypothetical protein CPB84DRAFT_1750048 [Gymnopilus junonius]|uniref:Uncharacterized protein n=1 Tax=Gymnopilus junonius TaxID=109634 RepID=A0A9P5NH24_GYMJU|nr:hypothetical protein CPB84DRAFT_1750048 [Gymnopilus junonius]
MRGLACPASNLLFLVIALAFSMIQRTTFSTLVGMTTWTGSGSAVTSVESKARLILEWLGSRMSSGPRDLLLCMAVSVDEAAQQIRVQVQDMVDIVHATNSDGLKSRKICGASGK